MPATPASRRRTGRARHAAAASAVATVVALALAPLLPAGLSTAQRLSLVSGYTSLIALLLTLCLGPLNVLLGRRNPFSSDLRRDAGLMAALTGLLHTAISLTNHFDGDVVLYFFDGRPLGIRALRADAFGLGSWLGLVAVALLLALSLTSSDAALRRLGRRTWKRIQRSNYVLSCIAVVHTALFWFSLRRAGLVVLFVSAAAAATLTMQIAGATRTIRRRRSAFANLR